MPDLSIVIVSYNTRDMLRDCLNALPAATEGLTTEVFVVDNASPDDSAGMVASEFPDARLIANQDNPGFTRANNQALRLSAGRHVVCLNPDTEARPGSLTLLVRYLEDHADVGATGPKLLNTDGSLQKNGRRFPNLLVEFIGHSNLQRLNRRAFERRFQFGREDFDSECEVDEVSGACLMVRREAMEKVGMFSEDFYMYYEEIEWCWRIKKAGWKVIYLPQSVVVHHHMGSVKQRSREMSRRLFESQAIYYRKTAGLLTRVAIRGVMLIGMLRNEWLHFGVGVKRKLRGFGLLR